MFAFFKEAGVTEIKPLTACFAVAGPVDRNTVAFTNRCFATLFSEEATEAFVQHKIFPCIALLDLV